MRSKPKENTIVFDFRHACDDMENRTSRNAYVRGAVGFAEYLREQGINKVSKLTADADGLKLLQGYADSLRSEQKRPSTIHTYLAGACHAIAKIQGREYSLRDIDKDRRAESVKGRDPTANEQGRRETYKTENARLVDFARALGLRRSEYGKLTGGSLKADESGYMCVWVKGKGGKIQPQRILPFHLPAVLSEMSGLKKSEHLFSREEMKNKIDLHSIRRDVAKQAYDYYEARLEADPGYAEKLKAELLLRFDNLHPMGHKGDAEARARFLSELSRPVYVCRGRTAEALKSQKKEPAFNRLALMAVSVFHLSHWRSDVTVVNYII